MWESNLIWYELPGWNESLKINDWEKKIIHVVTKNNSFFSFKCQIICLPQSKFERKENKLMYNKKDMEKKKRNI